MESSRRGASLVAMFFVSQLLSGCGAEMKPAASPPEMDAGQPSDVDPEGEGEDTSPAPVLREASVTGGGTTLEVSFEPFSLRVLGSGGEQRVSTSQRMGGAFAGVAFARAQSHNPSRFYSPAAADGGGLLWYTLAEVVSGEMVGPMARFVAASRDGQGQLGPEVLIEVEPGTEGVSLRVALAEDETLVFNSLTLEAAPGERYYGYGELFDRLDGRGLVREMQLQVRSDSESNTNEVHVPVPFVMSTRGYGVFLEDKHPAAFDMGATQDDAARLTSLSRDTKVHFLVADDPMEMVEKYVNISGKPARVPFWALAPQWWRNVNRDQAEVIEDARRGREADIPSTVMWIDRPWSSYYHNWRFNRVQFPDPEGMFEELHALGHRVLLHHSPQMNRKNNSDIGEGEDDSEDLFETFRDNGWLVTIGGQPLLLPWGGGQGAHIDWTHPEAVETVQQHITRVTSLGAIGTKMDWDEYLQPNAGGVRINVDYHNGESPLTMRIRYSALYHKTVIEGFNQALGEQSFHVSRSGTPGDQVWNTCIWPGDLDNDFTEHARGPSERQDDWNVGGLPAAIVANQSLGMGGYPCFASDIGGFRNGDPDEEVLMRWLAFGVFNAVTQLGGGGTTHMAWSADSPYSERALALTRRFFKLRMSLVPYVFQHLLTSHRTGRPLVRSLWMAYPQDLEARAHERDFLFGPELLVAPVYTPGATERALYLPEGRWVDFWTGASVEGGGITARQAPLDIIPVYLRAGAVVPLFYEGLDTLLPEEDPDIISLQDDPGMRVLVVPGPAQRVELYNGLDIETRREEGLFEVGLVQGEADADVDRRVGLVPSSLRLELALDGSGLEGAVTLYRGEGPGRELTTGETGCADCLEADEDSGRLLVILASAGRVEIR